MSTLAQQQCLTSANGDGTTIVAVLMSSMGERNQLVLKERPLGIWKSYSGVHTCRFVPHMHLVIAAFVVVQ